MKTQTYEQSIIELGALAFRESLDSEDMSINFFDAIDNVTNDPRLKRLAYKKGCKEFYSELRQYGCSEKVILNIKRHLGL